MAQPALTSAGGGVYIPDFLAQPRLDPAEILDLKTPSERLLMGRKRRNRFTAKMNDYIAQLEDYGRLFHNDELCEEVRDLHGLTIAPDPSAVIIAGRDAGTDKRELHRQRRTRRIDLTVRTYDDVRAALEHELARNFRVVNDLAGATMAAVVRFDPDGSGRPIRFLEVVDPASPSRFAVYTDQREDVVFEIVDRQGEARSVRARHGVSGFRAGEFFVLGCEFGSSEALTLMQIRVNDRVVEEWRSQDHIAVSATLDLAGDYSIMGTEGEPNGGTFYLRELVLAEFLTFRDRMRLARYLFAKHFSEDMSPLQGPSVEFGPSASISTREVANRLALRRDPIVGMLTSEAVTRLHLPHYVATSLPIREALHELLEKTSDEDER